MPQVLHAVAVTPPYEWDLTNISGHQTITVTAHDSMGHTASTSITVSAPLELRGVIDDERSKGIGCAVAGSTPGGSLFALALAVLFSRRRRR